MSLLEVPAGYWGFVSGKGRRFLGKGPDVGPRYFSFSAKGSVPDTGRYNDIKLKILRFSRKGVGCGEGKNLFSREKKDNGADVRP
ncbi:MAG: hypothetical protein IKC65_05585, partial [Lentisphaeria bacterium]|nr:hypothetical protein [Lentisphaeria bacterium]